MPTYCFKCKCGKKEKVIASMTDAPSETKCGCGEMMHRDFYAELNRVSRQRCDTWPMESDAAGISPDQIPEFREFDKSRGVETDYTSEGNPIFRSKSHRKRYCKAHGIYDRNAGYSDPAPVNR